MIANKHCDVYRCNKLGHLQRDCRALPAESQGRHFDKTVKGRQTGTHQVCSNENAAHGVEVFLFHDILYSDYSEILQVKLVDWGSCLKWAWIEMAGVPVIGVVDSRSDITIVNGELMWLQSQSCRKETWRSLIRCPPLVTVDPLFYMKG